MDYQINLTCQDGIVVAQLSGEDSYAACYDAFEKIITLCKQHNCFKVLGIQRMTPLKTIEAYDSEKIFRELGFTLDYSVAWVEEQDPQSVEMIEYAAAVLRNRKLVNVQIFSTEVDARKWLQRQ